MEINQPLAAIVWNANAALRWLALDPPNLARAHDSAELILRDGGRATEVIARIRALLKKTPPAKTLLDVNEFINEGLCPKSRFVNYFSLCLCVLYVSNSKL
jgi:hypothetical protein